MLHTIDNKGWEKQTAWCVPTAISLLTGIPLIHSHSRAAFIQNKNLNEVKGLFDEEAIFMLYEQGYKVEQIDLVGRYGKDTIVPIKKFSKDRTSYEYCMPLMVSIVKKGAKEGHMLSMHYDFIADNTSNFRPIFKELHHYWNNRWKVQTAYIVKKDE